VVSYQIILFYDLRQFSVCVCVCSVVKAHCCHRLMTKLFVVCFNFIYVLNIICSYFILNFVEYFVVFMKYHSYLQDCIEAIDDTQIDARVSHKTHFHFHGGKCTTTQNVMCVSNMNLCFYLQGKIHFTPPKFEIIFNSIFNISIFAMSPLSFQIFAI
jgi:hypothetical protein